MHIYLVTAREMSSEPFAQDSYTYPIKAFKAREKALQLQQELHTEQVDKEARYSRLYEQIMELGEQAYENVINTFDDPDEQAKELQQNPYWNEMQDMLTHFERVVIYCVDKVDLDEE